MHSSISSASSHGRACGSLRSRSAAGVAGSLAITLALLLLPGASAYPEFQQFIVKNAHRPVNCAMCHTHADGPEGTAPGQIGRLTPAEQTELGRARAAFEPGQKAYSPILNAFGNHILQSIGKKKVLEFRRAPEQLATALPKEGDLDRDGVADAREFLEGTHPLIASDGDPWTLFTTNARRNLPQLALTLAATLLGLYGLRHLLLGVARATETVTPEGEKPNP